MFASASWFTDWIYLARTGSTNDVARAWINEKKIKLPAVIFTTEQESGRGHYGSKWESEPGKNLLFSLVFFPRFVAASQVFSLSMVVSLGVRNYLAGYTGLPVRVKWPNDILIENKKVSGILIENILTGSYLETCIAGVGINVNQKTFSAAAPRAASLCRFTDRDSDPLEHLPPVVQSIEDQLIALREGKYSALREEWFRHLFGRGEELTFRRGEEIFKGIIRGVSPSGLLEVEMAGKIRAFRFKEIEYLY